MSARGAIVLLAGIVLAAPALAREIRSFVDRPDLPAEQVASGFAYLTEETQALQRDAFENPGQLWVEQGAARFRSDAAGTSCASCHEADRLVGAARRYPIVSPEDGTLLNLEARINRCRTRHQRQPAFAYESEPLLALTAYVASLSRAMPFTVAIDGPARAHFERGRAYWFRRKGQLNLACSQCHDDHFGRLLRGDRISQGHPNAFPAYRLEWQAVGSLHRRFRDCDEGIRAAPHAPGSLPYREVELYLAWRARSLPIETPGVRR